METREEIQLRYIQMLTLFLGFICLTLMVYILISLQSILAPFVIAGFLTFLLDPIVRFLRSHKVPTSVGIIIVVVVIFIVVYLVSLLVLDALNRLALNMPLYTEKFIGAIQLMLAPLHLTAQEIAEKFGLKGRNLKSFDAFKGLISSSFIVDSLQYMTNLLKDLFFVLIFWIFMIAGKARFEERFIYAFSSWNPKIISAISTIIGQVQSYIIFKSLLNLINGVTSVLLFVIFGIDYPIMLGVLCFAFHYIPNFGSVLAVTPAIILSIMKYGFELHSLIFIMIFVVFQSTMGNVIEPKFIGKRMDLSPVYVLLSLVFWGWVWGIIGMFLAVPIAATVKILLENIEPLKPLAILMSARADQTNGEDEEKEHDKPAGEPASS